MGQNQSQTTEATTAQPQTLGRMTNPASLGLPDWLKEYDLRLETGGRLVFVKDSRDGTLTIYVEPKSWQRQRTAGSGEDVKNYGVSVAELRKHIEAGVQTNDPHFNPGPLVGPRVTDGTPSTEAPQLAPGIGPGEIAEYAMPAAVSLLAVLLIGVGFLFRRRSRVA